MLSEAQARRKTVAHVVPLFAFLAILLLKDILGAVGFYVDNDTMYPWYRHSPEQWIYPLQTLAGLGILAYFWKQYDFRPVRGLGLATAMALLGIAVWIAPGYIFWKADMAEGWWKVFGFAPRLEGFDPTFVREEGGAFWYWAAVGARFLRMVVVVALVEEIFWRGFLMRFLLDKDGDFWEQPFGKPSALSFAVVTLLFALAHAPVDYFGALVYGSLTYWVAVRTKSLAACVVMHAVANLALGLYVMSTGQWGYW